VLDGYALCRAIVNSPDLAKIPVIFFSSLDNVESLKKGYEVGARDFLSKREGNDEQILNSIRANLIPDEAVGAPASPARPEPPDVLDLLHRSSFDRLGFGAAIVDLRRTLRFANEQAKPWFGLGDGQSLGQVDPARVEELVIGALQTLGSNGDEFMHPFSVRGRSGTVRMEEILNERQEIAGLLLLFWSREG
jgi:CheY-like chemotaxis protein